MKIVKEVKEIKDVEQDKEIEKDKSEVVEIKPETPGEITQEAKVMDLCRMVIPYFETVIFPRYIQDYKDYLGYKGDRAAIIQDWQTNVVYPLISSKVDTMYASMYDSKLKFNVTGKGLKGTDKLLNNAFDYQGEGRSVLMNAIKECIITGKGYIRSYFTNFQEKKIIRGKNYGRKIKRPVFEYKSVFNVFYDYNGTINESPFIIDRSIFNIDKINKKYASKIKKPDAIAYIKSVCDNKNQNRYSQYDVNRVKHIIAYEDMIKNSRGKMSTVLSATARQQTTVESQESIDTHNNVFAVDYEKNKVYEVIEYSDDDYVTVLIDGKLLYSTKRVKDLDGPDVEGISFNEIPGTSDSLGISSMLKDSQLVSNTLYNIYLDNLKMQIAPMFEQVGGMNTLLGKGNKITYEPYKIVPTNTPGSLRKVELGMAGFEPINSIQFAETVAREKVGINDYAMGSDGKVERVASGVDVKINQFKSRLMPLTNSINAVMGQIAKKILLMYATNYTQKELSELGLEDQINIETFLDERNISFQLSSLSLLENEEQLEYLNKNLQTLMGLGVGPDGKQQINSKEIIRAILTKEIDIEAIMNPIEPVVPGVVPGVPGVPSVDTANIDPNMDPSLPTNVPTTSTIEPTEEELGDLLNNIK